MTSTCLYESGNLLSKPKLENYLEGINSRVALIKFNVYNFSLFDGTDTMTDVKLFYCYCPDDSIHKCISIVIHSLIKVRVSHEVLLSFASHPAIKKILVVRLRRSEIWF